MDLTAILSQALAITSTFNLKIAIILFLLCSIGEIGFGLPYILETIWLLAGYQMIRGNPPLPLSDLVLIWMVAQAGRQTGSLVLYYSGLLGAAPLEKFYRRFLQSRLPRRQIIPSGIAKYMNNPSPFSVAAGRLVGLRVPMALTMSAKQKLANLALGVLISSVIWDGIYLTIGSTIGAAVVPKPHYMVLFSLGGLTAFYLIILGARYLLRLLSVRNKAC